MNQRRLWVPARLSGFPKRQPRIEVFDKVADRCDSTSDWGVGFDSQSIEFYPAAAIVPAVAD